LEVGIPDASVSRLRWRWAVFDSVCVPSALALGKSLILAGFGLRWTQAALISSAPGLRCSAEKSQARAVKDFKRCGSILWPDHAGWNRASSRQREQNRLGPSPRDRL
jgi:hypothetical protein